MLALAVHHKPPLAGDGPEGGHCGSHHLCGLEEHCKLWTRIQQGEEVTHNFVCVCVEGGRVRGRGGCQSIRVHCDPTIWPITTRLMTVLFPVVRRGGTQSCGTLGGRLASLLQRCQRPGAEGQRLHRCRVGQQEGRRASRLLSAGSSQGHRSLTRLQLLSVWHADEQHIISKKYWGCYTSRVSQAEGCTTRWGSPGAELTEAASWLSQLLVEGDCNNLKTVNTAVLYRCKL